MDCISPIVACLCSCLKDAFRSSAQAGFSFLGGVAQRFFWDHIYERQNKVILQPMDTTTLVGAEENLKTIRSHLLGNEVDVVGIVGMGGVGKTTLLKKINNEFYSGGAGNFNIVMFVTVSSEGDALKVRKKIAERLGLPEEQTDSGALSDALRGKRYLLLLDDVWGELDLSEIGVPFPNKENKCKIAVTTRSSDVFGHVFGARCRPRERALVVDVRKLDEAKSWELFRSKVDPAVDLDDPSIAAHAEKMVQKCDGLPLALVTVGKTMARATLAAEWREAERQWEESPFHLLGMDQVKSILMFDIDRLKGQGTLLPCFLYCSLFPEDYDIHERRLIEYWIGEGFLDGGDEGPPHQRGGEGVYGSLDSTRDKGKIVIKKFKDLCLLETGTRSGCVKMHDLLREVAMELAKLEPNRFVVHAFDSFFPESHSIIVDDEWEKATRVSLMSCQIQGPLPEMPRISTLLMPNVVVKHSTDLPAVFFTSMRNLVVLDLSFSLYSPTIPTSICSLSELRFLSLRGTDIRSLPKELGNLMKLRQLDLSATSHLEEIPQQAILRLYNLQVLNMIWCGYKWGLGGESNVDAAGNNGDIQLSVSDLDRMNQLQDFSIDVFRLGFLSDLGDSLLISITTLHLSGVCGLTTESLKSALLSMTRLRQLTIYDCWELTGKLILDSNAQKPMLSELEELTLYDVPLLAINITRDDTNEEGGDNSGYERPQRQWGGPLQKLNSLTLRRLPNLVRICDSPPQKCLPSLEYLDVFGCPLLRTLPLGPHSKIKEFRCEQEWWERLQWRRDQGDARRTAGLALRFV